MMEIKTNIRSGINSEDISKFAQDVGKGIQNVADGVGKAVSPVLEGAQKLVSNPKFWTWPF